MPSTKSTEINEPKDLSQFIDHTLLSANSTREQIEALCRQAREFNFAAVCVLPTYVSLAKDLLKDSAVKVATVIGFPLGATFTETKAFEATQCIDAGADELDMVINIGALKNKDYALVERDIRGVVKVSGDACVKVIIETAQLTDDEKIKACELSRTAGADYVKTCTGFGGGGATVPDVKLMAKAVKFKLKVKASGGIKTFFQAADLVRAGAHRIGTSSGINIVTKKE